MGQTRYILYVLWSETVTARWNLKVDLSEHSGICWDHVWAACFGLLLSFLSQRWKCLSLPKTTLRNSEGRLRNLLLSNASTFIFTANLLLAIVTAFFLWKFSFSQTVPMSRKTGVLKKQIWSMYAEKWFYTLKPATGTFSIPNCLVINSKPTLNLTYLSTYLCLILSSPWSGLSDSDVNAH